MNEKIAAIYKTFDYDQFKFMEANRTAAKFRVNKIIQSIEQVGYIVPSPILVNKDMEIIDGQGRFCACKEMGLPIYYTIADNAGINECIAMNMGQANWTTRDYINSYAARGYKAYLLLQNLIETYPSCTIDEIYGIVTNRVITNGYGTKSVKQGDLQLTKAQYLKSIPIFDYVVSLAPVVNLIPGSSRLKKTGIAWIAANTGCDRARLKDKLTERYPILSPVVDSAATIFLGQLSDMYNHHLSKDKCLYFDSLYKQSLKSD